MSRQDCADGQANTNTKSDTYRRSEAYVLQCRSDAGTERHTHSGSDSHADTSLVALSGVPVAFIHIDCDTSYDREKLCYVCFDLGCKPPVDLCTVYPKACHKHGG